MRERNHTGNETATGQMNLTDLISQLLLTHGWKAALSLILSFVMSNVIPIAPFLALSSSLVVCDFVTGLTAAYVKNVGITSRRMGRTVNKVIFYSMAIIMVNAVERVFFSSADYLVYLTSAYIAVIELYSNLENIGRITGTDILSAVRGAVDSRLGALRQKAEKNDDDNDRGNDQDQPAG